MRAVSKGSSEKDSKVRPASGVRTMHTVGTEQDVHALGTGLGGQRLPQASGEHGVPGRPDGHAAGERERAAPDEAVAADARGAVGDLEGRDAEALDRREVPEAGAGGE